MMADYIDRQALVEKLATLATRYSALGRVKVAQDYNWAITVLEGEPTADVAPVVHARWERIRSNWYCTGCHKGYRITNGAPTASNYRNA